MTADDRNPERSNSSDAPRQETTNVGVGSDDRAREEVRLEPRLCSYYSTPRIKGSNFVKTVRIAKIKLFDAQDVTDAAEQLEKADHTLVRTTALVGSGPDAIDRWLIEATKASLRLYLPGVLVDEREQAKDLLERVVDASQTDLFGKSMQVRVRSTNLLRLTLNWLFQSRNLTPPDALQALSRSMKRANRATATSITKDVSRRLVNAKLKQLLDFSRIASLFEAAMAMETRQRQEALAAVAQLREQMASLEDRLQAVIDELERAKEACGRVSTDLEVAKRELREERELRALERASTEGRFRAFMTERVNAALFDARDALEFDPPHVEAASQRIEMAITAITTEVSKSNE